MGGRNLSAGRRAGLAVALAVLATAAGAGTQAAAASVPRVACRPQTAYVTYDNQFLTSGLVTPINTRTNTAGPTISVGRDLGAIAITPRGRTVYVVSYGTGAVTPISTRTNKAGPPIPVAPEPGAIAITTGSCLPIPSRMCHPLEKGLERRNG